MRPAASAACAGAILTLATVPAAADSGSELWMEAGLSHELGDRFEASFDQHLRLDEGSTRVSAVMPELGLAYEALDWTHLETGYRLEYERDGDGELVVRHRFHFDAEVEVEPPYFALGYRLRLQEQIRAGGDELRHTLRNRVGVAMTELDPLGPKLEAEIFHDLGERDRLVRDKLRLTAGTKVDLGRQSVDLFYRLEIPQEEPEDPLRHIFGLEWHWQV